MEKCFLFYFFPYRQNLPLIAQIKKKKILTSSFWNRSQRIDIAEGRGLFFKYRPMDISRATAFFVLTPYLPTARCCLPHQPPPPHGCWPCRAPRDPNHPTHALPPAQLDSGSDAEPLHHPEHLFHLQVAIGDPDRDPDAQKIISICSIIITLRELPCCAAVPALLQSCVLQLWTSVPRWHAATSRSGGWHCPALQHAWKRKETKNWEVRRYHGNIGCTSTIKANKHGLWHGNCEVALIMLVGWVLRLWLHLSEAK